MVKSIAGSTPLAYSSPEVVQRTGTVARILGEDRQSSHSRPSHALIGLWLRVRFGHSIKPYGPNPTVNVARLSGATCAVSIIQSDCPGVIAVFAALSVIACTRPAAPLVSNAGL
jgi:hypothetical protein